MTNKYLMNEIKNVVKKYSSCNLSEE